LGKCPLAQ